MARPGKNNAEYFPHFTNLRNHRKVRALRGRFGPALGYAFWCMMLEWLTEHDGLEWDYSEMEIEMFATELGVSAAEIREMVDYCCKMDMLSTTDSGFVFSESLNENLQPVFEKRKKERDRSKQRVRRENGTFCADNIQPSGVSAAETPQSIVEKSKVKKKREKKSVFDPSKIDLPFSSDEFQCAWSEWCIHRIELKSKLTELAAKKQIEDLRSAGELDAIMMINKAIKRGWKGLFKLDESERTRTLTIDQAGSTRPRYLNQKG